MSGHMPSAAARVFLRLGIASALGLAGILCDELIQEAAQDLGPGQLPLLSGLPLQPVDMVGEQVKRPDQQLRPLAGVVGWYWCLHDDDMTPPP
jgi:hypothetical protein